MSEASVFKERLSQIISLPSVSCALPQHDMSNIRVIHTLAEWLEPLGFNCEIQEVAKGKANLIAVLGHGSGGLVLSGHSDTVPYDENRWQTDPFTVNERDNCYFGLGTCDMKGFFPVVLAAIEALALTPEMLKHPLIVLATSDEESSMSGARALVKQSLHDARYAIIGEPTSLIPIRMHKGIGMERLNIKGKAGHSSNPSLGNNAIEAMHSAINTLLTYRTELQKQHQNPAFKVAEPTMNLGCVHGGDNANRICGECYLDFDIRPLPGMDLTAIHDGLVKRLAAVEQDTGTSIEVKRLFSGVEAFEESENSDLVKLCEQLTGYTAESVGFATEAPFLQALGMQTIVLGPGSIDQAHQPNEYLHLDQISPAINIVKSAISRYCL